MFLAWEREEIISFIKPKPEIVHLQQAKTIKKTLKDDGKGAI